MGSRWPISSMSRAFLRAFTALTLALAGLLAACNPTTAYLTVTTPQADSITPATVVLGAAARSPPGFTGADAGPASQDGGGP